jgi:predicted Rossmann fold nucleotide-binding protein DprA/Smf involved in DNA uptake
MRLAFTGTHKGMTPRQHSIVKQILEEYVEKDILIVTHGCCLGADAEFHDLCLHFSVPFIDVWPCNIEKMTARLTPTPLSSNSRVILHLPQPPLDRNWDIVREADLVVACPESAVESLRSGTWATVRYADQLDKTIKVIKPYDDDTQ